MGIFFLLVFFSPLFGFGVFCLFFCFFLVLFWFFVLFVCLVCFVGFFLGGGSLFCFIPLHFFFFPFRLLLHFLYCHVKSSSLLKPNFILFLCSVVFSK